MFKNAFFLFSFGIAAASAAAVNPFLGLPKNDLIEAIIENSLDCVRVLMKDGAPEIGIPSFNPLYIGDRDLVLNDTLIKGSYKLNLLRVDGLANFETKKIKFDGPVLNYEFYLNVSLKGFYTGEGVVENLLPLNGDGEIDFNVELFVNGETEFTLGDKLTKLKTYLATIPHIKISGSQENEVVCSILGKKLNEKISKEINNNRELISLYLSPIVEEYVNSVMNITSTPELGELLEIVVRKCSK